MTKTAEAAATAAAARSVQLAIRARLLRDVLRLWPALDGARLAETWPGWIRGMSLLVRSYHSQSSTAAAVAYRATRQHATSAPMPSGLLKLAPEPAPEWLDKAFRFSGPGMLSRDSVKPGTALSTTLGTASRIVLTGARDTTIEAVKADPEAVGWYRLTDSRPCAFCALLASRGAVYKSEQTAGFEAHNDCGCTPAPAFSRGVVLPEISRTALEVYKRRGDGDPMAAFRKEWAKHLAATA
jgi:hypothetical protein